MPLQTHEAYELNHLLMGCYNALTCMGTFIKQVQCPELKSILERQLSAHIQDYNMKVDYAKTGACSDKLNVPVMPSPFSGSPKPAQPGSPSLEGNKFDDRAIAISYLLTLKSNGTAYAQSAFEADDPKLRAFLEDAFTMCSHHAYEVAGWLRKNGYYPGEPATTTYLQALGQSYDKARQMVPIN